MDQLNRRTLLKLLSAGPVAATFAVTEAEAQEAHHLAAAARQAQQAGTAYAPTFFTAHEYETVRMLADLIIPADERSVGATGAGVPEFMDFTMTDQPERQVAMRGGLAWLDLECQRRFDQTFVAATGAQRAEVLDDISTYGQLKPGLTHGQAFFRNFRDLSASGFWTSKEGIDDLGFIGNSPVAEWNGCPPDALAKLGL